MLTTLFSNFLTALPHLPSDPLLDIAVVLRLMTAGINLGMAVHRAIGHLRHKDR